MTPEEFLASSPGRVVRSVRGHWTFQPNLLPPALEFDAALIRRCSEAEYALGELAGIGHTLPNTFLFIRPFVSREAVLSSRIEGTQTRLDQLYLYDIEPKKVADGEDAREVQNYVKALQFGLDQIRSGYPFTLVLMRECHRILMDGVRGNEKRPGEFRDRAVLIGHSGQDFNQARFVPPCHTSLEPLLIDLVHYLREGRELPIVAQIALIHYQFETIHPFNDGNGRIGRLLISLLLAERGSLPQPLLYLSAYIEQTRRQYYEGLLAVSRRGAWNEFIEYIAIGVCEQARDATLRARRLLALWQDYRVRAASAVRGPAALRLVDELFAMPLITASRLVGVAGVTSKSAMRNIEKLVEIGLLREVTGNPRNRIYQADEILKLIDDPLDN